MAETTAPASQPSFRSGNAAFLFILVMVAFDMVAFGIIAPVLPDLIRQFEGGDFGRASDLTGYLLLVWNAMQFLFSPILGAWSDRFGRRPIILLSCFGLGIDYIVMALAPTLRWLFIGRIISGITSSTVPTAFAYIADVTPREKRAGAFGLIGAAFGIGFTLGPVVGGIVGNSNPRMAFWVAAAFSLTNWLYGFLFVPESLDPQHKKRFTWGRANP